MISLDTKWIHGTARVKSPVPRVTPPVTSQAGWITSLLTEGTGGTEKVCRLPGVPRMGCRMSSGCALLNLPAVLTASGLLWAGCLYYANVCDYPETGVRRMGIWISVSLWVCM